MSGKRAKRLRAAFLARYDRYPKRTRVSGKPVKTIAGGTEQVVGVTLPGRPYQDQKREGRLNGIIRPFVERLTILRALYEVTVDKPSEWRRWKKTAGDVGAFEARMGWRDFDPDARILPATELPEAR